MKKVLVIMLALLFVLSTVLLVACNATEVKITLKDVPATVSFGSTIDYSKISIEVEFDNGRKDNVSLTASGVTHNEINTYQAGVQTLSVNYKGLNAKADIEVLFDIEIDNITVLNVRNTQGYRESQTAKEEKTDKETEFYNRDEVYTVGNDNGYVFLPEVTWRYNGQTIPTSLPVVETEFTLSIKDGSGFTVLSEEQLATYVSVENNVYYFTQQAENETFKLDVTISDSYNLLSTSVPKSVSQIFEVVSGYNVYDAWGLSVLDNKNVKSWAEIKTRKLAWDNGKALSEFGDVKQIVLHNNIEVTVDYLPDNYFWHKGDEAKREGSMSYTTAEQLVPTTLKDYLPGSLKEAWLGEDWEKTENDTEQRGLYVSNGIGISGNYLKLSYDSNVDAADKASKGIYVVHDYKQTTTATNRQYPESHYSFVVYTHASADKSDGANEREEANIKGTRTIKNVYFYGETQKTDDISSPVGLMMLSADISGLEIINTISTKWYCNAQLDGVGMGSLKLEDCKFYESFSQMVFCWGIPKIDVTHCEMKRAGGPLFIIQTRTGTGTGGTNRNAVVNIDDTSNMESWLAGAETWFDINDLPSATVEQLFNIGTLSDSVASTNYKVDGKVNVIAVVIPDPGDVFKNQVAIPGTLTIGDTTYSMTNSVFSTLSTLTKIASEGKSVADSTLELGSNDSVSQLQAGFSTLATSTVSLQVAPVYQCGNAYGYFNGTALCHLDAQTIYSSVKALYGGSLQVASTLNSQAAQLESAGQAAQAAAVKALATQWTNVAASLQPIGALTFDASTWNTNWTAGHLAFWVNPGGLDSKNPNLNLKHFMVLFGEGAVA